MEGNEGEIEATHCKDDVNADPGISHDWHVCQIAYDAKKRKMIIEQGGRKDVEGKDGGRESGVGG